MKKNKKIMLITCGLVLIIGSIVSILLINNKKNEYADKVIYGKIYSSNDKDEFYEAVAIKDGKYIYTGDKSGVEEYVSNDTEIVTGVFIMPSGVESHAHYILEETFKLGLYLTSYKDDGSVKTPEELVDEIVKYREENPNITGIYGYGFDEYAEYGKDYTKEYIDAKINDIPVYISGVSLHIGWCNTRCLEMADVLHKEISAKGVARDENGIATGVIEDEACTYVRNKVFGGLDGYDTAIVNTQNILHSKGYTMLLDPWSNFDGTNNMVEAVYNADINNKLDMVVFNSYTINSYDDVDTSISNAKNNMIKYTSKHMSSKYVKLFADGTETAITAYMLEPYITGSYGTQNFTQELMNEIVSKSNKEGLLVHIHAYGDASAKEVIDAYENSYKENGKLLRNSIAHAPYITDEDLQRVKDLGIGISGSGNWSTSSVNESDNAIMKKLLGENRYKEFYMVSKFTDYGIKAGMSTDRPCANGYVEDIFDYIGVLTTGVDYRDGYEAEAKREDWVSVEEAIKMMTIYGAWSLDADSDRGSIEVGKYADFIIADKDPFSVELDELHTINVVSTYFEGNKVYSNDKEIVYLDMEEDTKSTLEYLKTNGGKEYLEEGLFEVEVETLRSNGIDDLPEVEVHNKLNSEVIGGYNVYSLEKDNYDKIVIYLHGGAYLYGILDAHVKYCDKLVDTLNAKVYMPLYPLSPNNTYIDAYKFLDEVYDMILKYNMDIIIAGDSAGGGLSLAYTEYLKNNNKKLPSNLILLSPWLDVTMSNEDIKNYIDKDLTLATYGTIEAGKLWAGNTDRKNYMISPIYGNLDSLPNILMFVGTDEIVYPDDMKLYNNVTNTKIKVVVGNNFWHVYPIYDIIEQSKLLDIIKDFVK